MVATARQPDFVRRPATYEELLALPENVVGEIVDGELHASARPAQPHAACSSGIAALLLAPFHFGRGEGGEAGPGGWWILFEPELHFWRERGGERQVEALVPDFAGWRRERLPRLAEGAAFTLAPDWVCEIVSPSTAAFDRVKKLSVYAREGVAHAWIVDPLGRSLEVFRLFEGHWLLVASFLGKETVRVEPFEAAALDLSLLWLPEEPPAVPPAEPPAEPPLAPEAEPR